jgi:hypothetical protein
MVAIILGILEVVKLILQTNLEQMKDQPAENRMVLAKQQFEDLQRWREFGSHFDISRLFRETVEKEQHK